MAPLVPPKCNQTVTPARTIPPDTISWRPMVVNWAGSMFFIGLCAPLMVWFMVYCVRTRKTRKKAKERPSAEPFDTARAAQPSMGRHDGTETYDLMPVAPGPSGRDSNNNRIPMSTHFRRYLGWWSSESSREATHPRDPRARKDRDKPYMKRDHFSRYLGWWTCSDETAKRPASNRTRSMDIKRMSNVNVSPTSTGSHNEIESFDMQPLKPGSRAWRLGCHITTHMSLENLAERGQLRSSQEISPFGPPDLSNLSPQHRNADTTGADVRHCDGSGKEELQAEWEASYAITGDLGTDETSGHKTVRRRTVGIAEACDWANLSSELRRSVHTQVLLPDNQNCCIPARDAPDANTILLDKSAVAKNTPSSTSLLTDTSFSQNPVPKLRKVYSSPTLRLAFKQLNTNPGSRPTHSTKSPTLSHSYPIPLHSHRDQMDGLAGEVKYNPSESSISTDVIHLAKSSTEMRTENVSKSSLAFSFDKTRRSTLDVIKRRTEADRQTLDDYEAESSVDAEMFTRDCSGSTMSSFKEVSLRKAVMHTGDAGDSSLNLVVPKPNTQTHNEMNWRSLRGCDITLHFGPICNKIPSGETHVSDMSVAEPRGSPNSMTDRFPTLTMPERRYSFPSLENGIDVKSEADRKFSFRFSNLSEKEVEATCKRRQSLPHEISKIPVADHTSSNGLTVPRKRAPRSGRSNTKRKAKAKPRKVTPFVDWNNWSSQKTSPRKTLPRDWQALDRLSEVASLLSENESPLSGRCEARYRHEIASRRSETTSLRLKNEPIESSNSPDRSTKQDFITCPTSPIQQPIPVTPKPHFFTPVRMPSTQDTRQAKRPVDPNTQDATEHTPIRTSEKMSLVPLGLTETQLSCGGSPIKRAFRSQSSAEKAKRRESMRRVGRLIGDGKDLKVAVNVDFQSGEREPSSGNVATGA